ncbi:hypothetical protein F2Q69_00036768 [Brassica cretica]|uniref:Uncharacterized protein n=1 Tax=Brassica cretica TaxID=69181 RepID=A0A8S9SCS4_BRACR|nr:hypothetical protein F2Q69_00036768 [Brassica cretica]
MAAEPPLSERCDNFLGRSSKDSDMVEIAPPAFASGSTTLEIQKETALLKLGSVGFHGGNVIVDRNDINRCWSAPLKSWTTLESGECLKLSLRLQKLSKMMMKSMNHHLRLSAITLLLSSCLPHRKKQPEDTVTVAGMYSAIPYAIYQVNHAQYCSSAIS